MEAKAVEQYHKQLERVRKYNVEHKEEMNDRSKTYYHTKIKSDPETYQKYLEQKREYSKKRSLKLKEKQN